MANLKSRDPERRARRMNDMIQTLDVDPVKLSQRRAGEAYAEAHVRCLDCSAVGECLTWLDGERSERPQPDFCPNVPLFETLKRG